MDQGGSRGVKALQLEKGQFRVQGNIMEEVVYLVRGAAALLKSLMRSGVVG